MLEHKQVAFKFDESSIDESGTFSGYAAVYGNKDQGGDIILEGAFTKSLGEFATKKPKMLWQHDPSKPIGVWNEMGSDSRGLKMTGRLITEVQRGREALALIKAGAIDGLSIGYRVRDFDLVKNSEGRARHLKDIDLMETSIVTFPMNTEATVTDVKQLQSPREVEHLLRKAGVPSAFAKLLALHGYEEAIERLERDPCDEDSKKAALQKGISSLLTEIQGLKETLNA